MTRGELIIDTLMKRGYARKEAKDLAIQIILNLDNYERILDLARKQRMALQTQVKRKY